MKRRLLLLALVLALLIPWPLQARTGSNIIVAVVDDQPITLQDVELDRTNQQAEADFQKQYQGATLAARISEVRLKTLDRLIEEQLSVQEFKREGRFYTDAQIDNMVKDHVKTEYGGDMDKFHAALVRYDETEDELREILVNVVIEQYMIKENVNDKLASAPAGTTRDSLLKAWIASLRSKIFVKMVAAP